MSKTAHWSSIFHLSKTGHWSSIFHLHSSVLGNVSLSLLLFHLHSGIYCNDQNMSSEQRFGQCFFVFIILPFTQRHLLQRSEHVQDCTIRTCPRTCPRLAIGVEFSTFRTAFWAMFLRLAAFWAMFLCLYYSSIYTAAFIATIRTCLHYSSIYTAAVIYCSDQNMSKTAHWSSIFHPRLAIGTVPSTFKAAFWTMFLGNGYSSIYAAACITSIRACPRLATRVVFSTIKAAFWAILCSLDNSSI
jgi:hypothetical protein